MRRTSRPRGTPRPIVVVSHEASRTGAPRVGVEILRALVGVGAQRVVVHRWGGPLVTDFDAAADASVVEPWRRLRVVLRRWRRTRRLAVVLEERAATRVLRRLDPSVVWCNTVLAACYVRPARRLGVPVILLSHESAADAQRVLARYDLTSADIGPRRGIVPVGCSPVAAAGLASALGVDPAGVSVLSSPIDVAAVRAGRSPRATDEARTRVVGCGRATAGKGVDLFIGMAERLSHERPGRFEFVWIGEADPRVWASDAVRFTGEVDRPAGTMSTADIFVHAARTDQFPLVVLEAMALAIPVVASDVGDIAEQLGDTGLLVPPEDLDALVEAVRRLADEPGLGRSLGRSSLDRVTRLWDVAPFAAQVRELTTDRLDPRARVLNVVWRLSQSGGVQTVVRNIIGSADTSRFDHHVVSVRPEFAEDRLDALLDGAHLHALGLEGPLRSRDRVAAVVEVARIARRVRPDVVHTHSGTVWLSVLARLTSPSAACLIEVHDAPGNGRHGGSTERFEGLLARFGGYRTLCHSSSVRDEVIATWRPPRDRLWVFPLGIDTARFASQRTARRRSRPVVLYVARLVSTKNVPLLLATADRLRHRFGDDAPIVRIVAGGVDGNRLECELDDLDLRDVVELTGPLNGSALEATYADADLFCSTSDYEGFGLAVVEAMAAGLPVVATAVGGIVDVVVDGLTGILVPPRDVAALVDAISELLTDRERARQMGEDGRVRAVEHFDAEQMVRRFEDLYAGLAGGR